MAGGKILKEASLASALAGMIIALIASTSIADTVVRFDTVMGTFDVQLFDTTTPITVGNFLNYVRDADYDDSFFHRLVPGFVLQGGGFYYDSATDQTEAVPTDPPIQNEFQVSNTRGTIVMAKLGGDPDSATSQFFFNLTDNSANLDNQNGGFTVFGEVIGSGMDVVDLLASQNTWDGSDIHPAFGELPVLEYPTEQTLHREHLAMIDSLTFLGDYGDLNNDGETNEHDVDPFVLALTIRPTWLGEYPGLNLLSVGDLNGDFLVNAQDINPFVDTLAASSSVAVPEPATIVLLAAAAPFLLRRRQKS